MMKRAKKIEFRVTHTEYFIIQNKALKSGNSISEFLRNTALDYPLTYKLTEDEILAYRQLSQYADNFRRIGNLFKLGDTTGVKEACIETTKLIRNHLNKLK
ncbi:mobilization protein [Flavobacterium sp.]|uniref:plasmid mobilization protein n=1 Tax=Flavobacterium sp. TaxID=239 RepID=UPI002630D61F|nr:mobilization protein [Flavobacterium sp.]